MASSPDDALVPRYRHVLVPLDGSDLARGAVPTAAALAERFGADVHAVSVVDDRDDTAAARLHASEAIGVPPDDDRIDVTMGGDPAAAIARRADELGDCLVCLSSHGRGRLAGAVVGSVARAVLQATRRPVVVVGPALAEPDPESEAPPPPLAVPRLVACVDGGTTSEAVLPVAGAWARTLGMALSIVTVAEPTPPPNRPGAPWHRLHGPAEDADAYVGRLATRWREAAGTEVDGRAVEDPIGPADGLEVHLREHPAGLVALTTHAREGLRRVVLGSGAAAIISRSSAPVLVVPLERS